MLTRIGSLPCVMTEPLVMLIYILLALVYISFNPTKTVQQSIPYVSVCIVAVVFWELNSCVCQRLRWWQTTYKVLTDMKPTYKNNIQSADRHETHVQIRIENDTIPSTTITSFAQRTPQTINTNPVSIASASSSRTPRMLLYPPTQKFPRMRLVADGVDKWKPVTNMQPTFKKISICK